MKKQLVRNRINGRWVCGLVWIDDVVRYVTTTTDRARARLCSADEVEQLCERDMFGRPFPPLGPDRSDYEAVAVDAEVAA